VAIKGNPVVEFRASVKEIVITRLFTDVPISGVDLEETLMWEEEEQTGRMTLMGPQLLMDDLREDDIVLTVSLAGIETPGDYRLTVRPAAPPRLSIRSYQPAEITVSIIPRLQRVE
jgi:hypothetical protein